MAELLEFDPTSEDAGNSPLSVMTSTYRVVQHSYASPEEEVLYASSVDTEGALRASSRPPNRTISMTIEILGSSASNLRTLLTALQRKIVKIRREGGTLKRTSLSGEVVVFDLITAGEFSPRFDLVFEVSNLIQVDLTFTAKPDGRLPQVTSLSTHTEATNPALIFTETGLTGDADALGELTINEVQGVDQAWVIWGKRTKYYDSAATAALFFESSTRTTQNGASSGTVAGASGGTAVSYTCGASLLSMLSTQASGGGAHLTHVGAYRVFARVQADTSAAGSLSFAFQWAVGDFHNTTVNPTVSLTSATFQYQWQLVDLGIVTLPEVPVGSQRWEGRVLAASTRAGDIARLDYLMFVPVAEGSGELVASTSSPDPSVLTANDNFETKTLALPLHGTSLNAGGTWSSTGSTGDFSATNAGGAGQQVRRATTADSDVRTAVTSAAAVAATAVQVDVVPIGGSSEIGAVGRWVSNTNFVSAAIGFGSFPTNDLWLQFGHYFGGGSSLFTPRVFLGNYAGYLTWWRIRMIITASGRYAVWAWAPYMGQQMPSTPQMQGYDSALATGGTSATGKIGFYDYNYNPAVGTTRYVDNFQAWTPVTDAAMFASQSARVDYRSAWREDSTGTVWGEVATYEGDYLTVQPAGAEGLTTQFIVKASRSVPGFGADDGIDDISAKLVYTPRVIVTP